MTPEFDKKPPLQPGRSTEFVYRTLMPLTTAGVFLAVLSACGGGDDPAPQPEQPLTAAQACAALAGMTIPAAQIGLPTTGARIDSTELVAAAGRQPEFCRVLGSIAPVDPSAPSFQFTLGLPTTWNNKAIQQGGGGYNGSLIAADRQPSLTDVTTASPMARGFVTFSSDGGHQAPNGSFALNDEAFANYAGDELKKTYDVSHLIIRQRYGSTPRRTYFIGYSEGGREALYVTQRYASMYDGVISGAPVYSLTAQEISNIVMFQKHYAPGGLMTNAKMTTLKAAVMNACDGLDNVVDGIVSNPDACHFDPATLLCPGGADTSDACLSQGQLETINAIGSPVRFDFQLSNGVDSYLQYPILKGATVRFGSRAQPGIPADSTLDARLWAYGDIAVRYFIVRDPLADLLAYRPNDYIARTQEVSRMGDATSTNLDAFRARGGKLLLTHGAVDTSVSPDNTTAYYQRLVAQYGRSALDQFMRYYVIPGYDHSAGNPFMAGWDDIAALDAWVEQGTAPASPVVNDIANNVVVRSRPLCAYPTYPRYVSGDVNAAASFTCATP